MRFQTGNTIGKGRVLGSKSKNSNEIRVSFQLLLDKNIDQLQSDLIKLEPKDRVSAILSIAKLILPSLQSISLENSNSSFRLPYLAETKDK